MEPKFESNNITLAAKAVVRFVAAHPDAVGVAVVILISVGTAILFATMP